MGKYFCAKCKFFDDDVGFYRHQLVNFDIISRVCKLLVTRNPFCFARYQRSSTIVMNVVFAGPNHFL